MGKSVSVIGLGKLGACMVAAMASKGMQVIGVDVNPKPVELVNQGKAPVSEPNLDFLIQSNRERIRATSDFRKAVFESQISFIIVPTPSENHGGFSLQYVQDAVREIGLALREKREYHLVALTSTVLPGSTEFKVLPILEESSGKTCGKDFGLCYNPEFIALGSVIHDLLNPDFILIGESDKNTGDKLEAWYKEFCDNQPPVARMSFINAEVTKISLNTFVTTKIAFANTLAGLCEGLPGADIDVVSSALGLDSRIGKRYLTGALGYGGPCFPRDNQALTYTASQAGAFALLAEATDTTNRQLLSAQIQKIRKRLVRGMKVAVLGLAYKPDTNVVEESQAIALTKALADSGFSVMVYDPHAMENAGKVLNSQVHYASSIAQCLEQANAVIITNPSREFSALQPGDFPRKQEPLLVFDCWRILRKKLEACSWIQYIPLGVGAAAKEKVTIPA